MSFAMLILIVILIIVGIRNNSDGDKPKEKTKYSTEHSTARPSEYLRLSFQNIDAFLRRCYNENTLVFDWHSFYHDDDGVWEDEASQNYLRSQMKSIGIARRQGMYELLIHGKYNPGALQAKLQEKSEVIQNLTDPIFGACPQYVKQFQKDLQNLAYGKNPCTSQNIQRVMDRYDAGR